MPKPIVANPPPTPAPRWLRALNESRRIHTELAKNKPYRDDGLIPEPAATPAQVDAAEQRLGIALPPSYREFLLRHNGWKRFFDGAHLLGAHELGNPEHIRQSRQLLLTSLPTRDGAAPTLLPFAVDSQMCSVFAFDANYASAEKPVVAWVGELGLVASNFPDFLELLVEVAATELNSSHLTGAVNLSPDTASSAA